MTEDMTSLEQRVVRLEGALAWATAELERLRVGQRRAARASRVLTGIVGTSLGLVLLEAARGGLPGTAAAHRSGAVPGSGREW
jgi:hypothetical protein